MTNTKQINEIYKCNVCGNMIETIRIGGSELVCCGQPMELLHGKTQIHEGKEKHVPIIITQDKDSIIVKVGSLPHPTEKEHYIEWIEIVVDEVSQRQFLRPGDTPQAVFKVPHSDILSARAYCNTHGLWRS